MDQCRDVLELAAYNFTQMANTGSYAIDLKHFFLSDTFATWVSQQDSGFSLGIPPIGDLPPLQIGASSSSSQIQTFQQRIQQMSQEQYASLSEVYFTTKLVDHDALDKWEKCMDGHAATEIKGDILLSGKQVQVSFHWERIDPTDSPPEVKSFDYAPLVVSAPLNVKVGTVINTDGVSQRFERVFDSSGAAEPGLVVLSTTKGFWRDKIEAISPGGGGGGGPKIVTLVTTFNATRWLFQVMNAKYLRTHNQAMIDITGVPPDYYLDENRVVLGMTRSGAGRAQLEYDFEIAPDQKWLEINVSLLTPPVGIYGEDPPALSGPYLRLYVVSTKPAMVQRHIEAPGTEELVRLEIA